MHKLRIEGGVLHRVGKEVGEKHVNPWITDIHYIIIFDRCHLNVCRARIVCNGLGIKLQGVKFDTSK